MSSPAKLNDPEAIAHALRVARTIAVVGCSPDPSRPSNSISRYLISAGYNVIPVYPAAPTVLGRKSYPSLDAIPKEVSIDIVDVFLRPDRVPDVAEAALRRGVGFFWMQEGVVSPASAEKLRRAGIPVAMDRCIYKDRESIRASVPLE